MITEEKIQNSHPKLFSKEYFETFSAKHSWEPGWLVELRKESWENLKNNESNDLKKKVGDFPREVDLDILAIIALLIPRTL